MSNLPIYEMLAQCFASEGVDTLFNLMGDGNMHWATAMSKIDGVQVRMTYAGGTDPGSERTVHPLGLVVKGSVWYLVAGTDAGHEALWPPYERGAEGFVRLATSVLPALSTAAQCWAELLPDAHHVWVDTAEHHSGTGVQASASPELAGPKIT